MTTGITALITSYETLKSAVAGALNRGDADLTAAVPTLIQLAEATFRRDRRFRRLQDAGTFLIQADGDAFPSDFHSLETWYHDTTSNRGPIQIVSAELLANVKATFGPTGVPRFASLTNGVVRYGPEPADTYQTRLKYWRKIVSLSDTNPTNWLLQEHPDAYYYGALLEAEMYLQHDERAPLWESRFEKAANQIHLATTDAQFSGKIQRVPVGAIGSRLPWR